MDFMTSEEADDLVDAWHNGDFPDDWELSEVFIDCGWTWTEFVRWTETGKVPE